MLVRLFWLYAAFGSVVFWAWLQGRMARHPYGILKALILEALVAAGLIAGILLLTPCAMEAADGPVGFGILLTAGFAALTVIIVFALNVLSGLATWRTRQRRSLRR